jgi:hypothetical protein
MDRLECIHPAFRPFVRCTRLVLEPCADAASAALPEQPIRVIFPFSQGPAGDSVSRMIAQGISESVKQAVVVELRPAANGILGSDIVAKVQHAAIGQRVAQDRGWRQPAPGALQVRRHAEIVRVLRNPELKDKVGQLGIDVVTNTPAWRGTCAGRYKPIGLATMLRWISLVPAPMGPTRESRKYI